MDRTEIRQSPAGEDRSLRLAASELSEYWEDLSRRNLSHDRSGFSVVCYAGMPKWFNSLLDRYQRKALARIVRRIDLRNANVLDLGTGVGRWAKWFAARGAVRVAGVDIDSLRLTRAAEIGGHGMDYLVATVDGLPFRDQSFDVVNCVTVLQHVPDDVKERAIAEVARVLKPGGYVTLFELVDTRDDAPHVFPWARGRWAEEFQRRGFSGEVAEGDQYIPLIRLALGLFRWFFGRGSRQKIDGIKRREHLGLTSRAYLMALAPLVLLSYPLEELCVRLAPSRFARINGFLFQRVGDAGAEG